MASGGDAACGSQASNCSIGWDCSDCGPRCSLPPPSSAAAGPAATPAARTTSLPTARFARARGTRWCANPTAAVAIYGPISLWNISQVSDLSHLFCSLGLPWATNLGPGLRELQQ